MRHAWFERPSTWYSMFSCHFTSSIRGSSYCYLDTPPLTPPRASHSRHPRPFSLCYLLVLHIHRRQVVPSAKLAKDKHAYLAAEGPLIRGHLISLGLFLFALLIGWPMEWLVRIMTLLCRNLDRDLLRACDFRILGGFLCSRTIKVLSSAPLPLPHLLKPILSLFFFDLRHPPFSLLFSIQAVTPPAIPVAQKPETYTFTSSAGESHLRTR